MERGLMKTLELCIENPAEILSSDEKIPSAETLLLQTSKLISENKIDLGEKEKRKKLEKVQELAAGLGEYKKRLELLNKQLKVQTQVSEHPVQKQVARLKHSIEQNESKLKLAKASAEELGQKLSQTKDEIEKKRVDMEKSLGETLGAKVELTF
jgi:chromosome segregation ATPase